MATVVVIGKGGREHAIIHRLVASDSVKKVFAIPGNPGISAERSTQCIDISTSDHSCIETFCKTNGVDLVIVGPELPLAKGIADDLENAGIKVFGPSKSAARIESDKNFSKNFMNRHGIRTADSASFTDKDEAVKFIRESGWTGWAVKACGLAGGKGVIVAATAKEAESAVDELMDRCGEAADEVLVERRLHGYEVSGMCLTDGSSISMLPISQDHKTRFSGDTGPNTGGMGAVCPFPVNQNVLEKMKNILQKTVDGMASEGNRYKGVLYAGFMMVEGEPFVLEFNCRLGDPETEAIMSIVDEDLYALMKACVEGTLSPRPVRHLKNTTAATFVVVWHEYPANGQKGVPITGIERASSDGVLVYHMDTARKEGTVVTSGGRILAVTGLAESPALAVSRARAAALLIDFGGGAQIRDDIGAQLLERVGSAYSYARAGVDVACGERFVEDIKALVEGTHDPQVQGGIGGFGALYSLHSLGMKKPVLVSGTDGVGTKLLIAQAVGRHDTIGQDLVGMCVNDIVCQGAKPLFFLDYLANSRLDRAVMGEVIKGIASACKKTGTSLVGGETAEMPGMYQPGEYDVAGFAVGVVEEEDVLPKLTKMGPGDCIIGLPSSGFHSNGFSLVRKIISDQGFTYSCRPFGNKKTLGEVLLTPTKLYQEAFSKVKDLVLGAAHITGGGIIGNAHRCLPDHLAAKIDITRWSIPQEMMWLASYGISPMEMAKTFNLGVGMIFIVDQSSRDLVLERLKDENPREIGEVVLRKDLNDKPVFIENLYSICPSNKVVHLENKIKVGILISGRGSNMQAIIEKANSPNSPYEVVMVISNKPEAAGLKWASQQNIPTKIIDHTEFSSRESFEAEVTQVLQKNQVQLVCLAGFMRIVTGSFVEKWRNRLINIHPSLLPSFKGKDAIQQALDAKVKIAGSTVHYVEVEIDSGEILGQASVEVVSGDDEDSLGERIRAAEHILFPKTVWKVSREMIENQKRS